MSSKLNVSLIQCNSGPNKADNLFRIFEMMEAAVLQKGAKLVALPEVFPCRGTLQVVKENAETLDGPIIKKLQSFAQKHAISILAGSFCEKAENGNLFNTSVCIDQKGVISGIYRKLHLFDAKLKDANIQESATFSRGESPTITNLYNKKIGLSICYDIRFSYLYDFYAQNQCEILSIPASFTSPTGKAHWHTLVKARAIETQSFVLAPNQVGVGAQNVPTYGHSLIVDPWGDILAEGSETQEEVISAELNFEKLDTIRASIPMFFHRVQI